MADLPSASEITSVAGLLAPGLIILAIRARFKDGAVPELKEQILGYCVVSVAYYAAAYPLFHASNGVALSPWFWQLIQYFVAPIVVASAVVAFDQSETFYRICKTLGLRLSHHIPAAWDYAFSKLVKGTYVLVKLQDGTLYAGLMGRASFASSASSERDLYIEEVWSIEKAGAWEMVKPRRGVLLCGKDIRWIEIFTRS